MKRSIYRRNIWHLTRVSAIAILCAVASNAGEVKLGGRVFTIPDGFSIEQIAGPPLVDRPITAAFDERGVFMSPTRQVRTKTSRSNWRKSRTGSFGWKTGRRRTI